MARQDPKPFLIALALAAAPFAAQAETWNIYGWQNHSWEFVDIDGGRSFDRIQSNAGNIGFAASVPTGMNDISVNVRCEQFTYLNQHAGRTGWCNRNSKIGLSHPQMGEIMFATWLLPYNEGVAQWVDPFYDAGSDSHTSIMGSVGANTIFYNTGDFSGFDYTQVGAYDTGFNRRQEHIIQYWSPNWNGFVFRFAWTAGSRDETGLDLDGDGTPDSEIDPVIRSSSLAYTNGPLWLAVTWQDHEDWTAASVGNMEASDAESFRIAGRYIMDMGDGMSVQISAMWEDLEYEFNGVTDVDSAMAAFGYSKFSESYDLMTADGVVIALGNKATKMDKVDANGDPLYLDASDEETTDATKAANYDSDTMMATPIQVDTPVYLDADGEETTDSTMASLDADGEPVRATEEQPETRAKASAGQNVKIERDAWMVSGKIKFGGPVDFRFSYMDADDLEVSCASCTGDWDETAADAWNVGVFYTMPAGTELRLTYSEVDNDDNGTYGQGISGTGLGTAGAEVEMFAVGIVHWFD